MSEEKQLQTEFEIVIPTQFFYRRVLPHFGNHGYTYEVFPSVDSVGLHWLCPRDGTREDRFTLAAATCLVESILRDATLTRYLLTTYRNPRPLYRFDTETAAHEGLRSTGLHVCLYQNCAGIPDEEGFQTMGAAMAKGRLPYMAYHCAVDGLLITHVSQAFFEFYCIAQDALEIFGSAPGFGSVYVCIDDRGSS